MRFLWKRCHLQSRSQPVYELGKREGEKNTENIFIKTIKIAKIQSIPST